MSDRLECLGTGKWRAVTSMGAGILTNSVWGQSCTCAEFQRNAGTTRDCSHRRLYWWRGPLTEARR